MRLAVWVGSVVALGVIPVVLYVASRNYPINAKVGDCLTGDAITSTAAQDASDARIVSCANPDARYKVVGKIDNRTKAQFIADPTMCGRYRGAGATSALWGQAIGGRNGFVLCLADNR